MRQILPVSRMLDENLEDYSTATKQSHWSNKGCSSIKGTFIYLDLLELDFKLDERFDSKYSNKYLIWRSQIHGSKFKSQVFFRREQSEDRFRNFIPRSGNANQTSVTTNINHAPQNFMAPQPSNAPAALSDILQNLSNPQRQQLSYFSTQLHSTSIDTSLPDTTTTCLTCCVRCSSGVLLFNINFPHILGFLIQGLLDILLMLNPFLLLCIGHITHHLLFMMFSMFLVLNLISFLSVPY